MPKQSPLNHPSQQPTTQNVITCFEHQILNQDTFACVQDFNYLLEHELPCVKPVIKHGKLALQLTHYLADIWLPSGIRLEILPKIGKEQNYAGADDSTRAKQIRYTRSWVQKMLGVVLAEKQCHITPTQTSVFTPVAAALNLRHYANAQAPTTLSTALKPIKPPQNQWGRLHQLAVPWASWLFSEACKHIASGLAGLPKQYRKQSRNQPRAMGKLNVRAQIKHNAHRPHFQYRETQELSNAKPVQDYLSLAWHHANHWCGEHGMQPPVSVIHNSHLRQLYEKATHLITRLNSQLSGYEQQKILAAMAWATWVLLPERINEGKTNASDDRSQPLLETINLPYPATLINMPKAFELWVTSHIAAWVTTHLPHHQVLRQPSFDWLFYAGSKQKSRHELRETTLSSKTLPNHLAVGHLSKHDVLQKLVPDVVIKHKTTGRISHVIDIKYKQIFKPSDVISHDWHQLHAYQSYTQAMHGWLVYPQNTQFSTPFRVDVGTKVKGVNDLDKQCATMSIVPFDVVLGILTGVNEMKQT